MTDAQERVLNAISDLTAELGYAPTIREVGARVGLRSSSTVHTHVANLTSMGLVAHNPTKSRTLRSLGPSERA